MFVLKFLSIYSFLWLATNSIRTTPKVEPPDTLTTSELSFSRRLWPTLTSMSLPWQPPMTATTPALLASSLAGVELPQRVSRIIFYSFWWISRQFSSVFDVLTESCLTESNQTYCRAMIFVSECHEALYDLFLCLWAHRSINTIWLFSQPHCHSFCNRPRWPEWPTQLVLQLGLQLRSTPDISVSQHQAPALAAYVSLCQS